MTKDGLNFQVEPGSAALRLVPENVDRHESAKVEKQFVNFSFFRVNPDWRRLDVETKRRFKQEFIKVFDSFRKDFLIYCYSLVGFDSKADIMFWRVGRSLDLVQDMTSELFRTSVGRFLETTDNYLSTTRRMMFVDGPAADRLRVQAGTGKYHFVFPCANHQDWYEMSADERDALIEENFMVGKKFPNIKIHMTHAFGFNDPGYLISFETDEPRDFLSLVEELRQNPAIRLPLRGMPVYTCRQRTLLGCLDAIG